MSESTQYNSSQIKIGIHPIVILTISDFYSRMNITSNGKINKVYGGLLGLTKGDKCEIFSAFEFYNSSSDDSEISLDISYIDERRKLTEQLYPNLEIVGLFMTNNDLKPSKNQELWKWMDYFGVVSPLCLVLSTDLATDELPIAVYSVVKDFAKLEHTVEGCESERICLETVTKSSDFQNNESAMIQNMLTIKSATDVLRSNLNVIKMALSEDCYKDDSHFVSMVDELVRNYPNSESEETTEFLKTREKEIMILNNICADSVLTSHLGKVDSFNIAKSEIRNGFNNFNLK